jgi:cytochrome c oxidase subunit 2
MLGMWVRQAIVSAAAFAASLFALPALAVEGHAHQWEIGLQNPGSLSMVEINRFHNLLTYIIIAIAGFVLVLLLFVIFRFRERVNPTPSRTTHNTLIEVVWTVVPVMILVLIAVPSFRLLYYVDHVQKGKEVGLTVKAIGHQWYWQYEYQLDKAGNGFRFDSRIMCQTHKECREAAKDNGGKVPLRLLDVDNRVVVPVNTNIRLLTTGADVIHSWAVPSFGVKLDAVPGRTNETWFNAPKEGVYYGMCSELCGPDHGFMPIAVQVVSKEKYAEWVAKAKTNSDFEQIKAPPKKADARPAAAKAVQVARSKSE